MTRRLKQLAEAFALRRSALIADVKTAYDRLSAAHKDQGRDPMNTPARVKALADQLSAAQRSLQQHDIAAERKLQQRGMVISQ